MRGENNHRTEPSNEALFEARLEDLGPGDLVIAECACGHSIAIQHSTLVHGLRLQPYERILDLAPRMRCRECDERGKVVVSVRWAPDGGG